MLADLARLIRRRSVIELAVAFVLGTAALHLVDSLVQGLVITPIETSHREGLGEFQNPLSFAIGGARFYYDSALGYFLSAVILTVLVLLVLRMVDSTEIETRSCPHCLEDVPIGAAVCSFCTRDLPPTPT